MGLSIAKTMTTAEREQIVVERRAARVPFRAIAAELGISLSRAHQIFTEACNRIPAEAVHTIRVESSDLHDRAIRDLLSIAENPQISPRTRVEAWAQVRSFDESHRKLMGADAPVRKEVTIISDDTVNQAIAELTKEMMLLEGQAKEAGIDLDKVLA